MSYFVFGTLDAENPHDSSTRELLGRYAREHGIFILFDGVDEADIVRQMRSEQGAHEGIEYWCQANVGDDTSHDLIVLESLEDEAQLLGLRRLASWARDCVGIGSVRRLRMWIAEGHCSNFEKLAYTGDSFEADLTQRIAQQREHGVWDVPPIAITVERSGGQSAIATGC